MSRLTIVDLDTTACVVASVSVARGRVRVHAACTLDLPGSASSLASPEDVGAAIRAAMNDAGIRPGPTIVAVPRGDVSVKLLDLPGAAALDPAELGETVRLQMLRQLSSHGESLVVDYLPPQATHENAESPDAAVPQAAAGTVVAAAMSSETLERVRAIVKAFGGKPVGVRLRSSGARVAAALAHEATSTGESGDAVTVAWQPRGAEIVVGRAGRLTFVRGVDVPRPPADADPETVIGPAARRLAVEVSRTVVSYRVTPGGRPIERITVLGNDAAAIEAAAAIASATRLPVVHAACEDAFEGIGELQPTDAASVLPLLGLASLHAAKERSIDFHSPIRPPDRTAGARQLVLAAMLGLVVLAGVGYVLADGQLRPLDRRIEQLTEEQAALQSRYTELVMDQARINHAGAWLDARADLASHLRAAVDQLPPPPGSLLDSVTLTARDAVGFTPGENLATPTAFVSAVAVDARIAGSVASQALGADLRARLLQLDLYATVTSRGPEVAGQFDLELRSTLPDPSGTVETESTSESDEAVP